MRLIISLNLGALPRTRYKVKIRRKRRIFVVDIFAYSSYDECRDIWLNLPKELKREG